MSKAHSKRARFRVALEGNGRIKKRGARRRPVLDLVAGQPRLGAQAGTTPLRGEEPEATGDREAAHEGKRPRLEAGAGERHAADTADTAAADAEVADADSAALAEVAAALAEVAAAMAVAAEVTATASDVGATGAEVLLLVDRSVRVTASVLLDDGALIAGVAATPGRSRLVDVTGLLVVARVVLPERDSRDGSEDRERDQHA